jgi:8-oxo-dGTP diphosphatase
MIAMLVPPKYGVTVDIVLFTIREAGLNVLMVQRKHEPYAGRWAFPGGFVDPDEDLPDAVWRELAEETGVRSPRIHLEQLASYGEPKRDPRGRTVTVAFLGIGHDLPHPQGADDAAAADWKNPLELLRSRSTLAFDHGQILRDGLERLRSKIEYTPLATAFVPREFTVAELRNVYDVVWDAELDPRNFHRKVTGTEGFLVSTGKRRVERGRPAELYRVGRLRLLNPPMLRPGLALTLPASRGGGAPQARRRGLSHRP